MARLVLLVVAAAWAAVLIPPMLRSRVDNRPNSSVTDFRRQLSKLQSTATPGRAPMRAMGRPLAQSPLQRPAAAARPTHPHHRQASLRSGTTTAPGSAPTHHAEPAPEAPRYRTHGDPSGGHPRPAPAPDRRPAAAHNGAHATRPADTHPGQHHHRQTHMARAADPNAAVKRRRTNVLFVLVITTACTMFLAATTSSTTMLYVFALSFLALCGYVYLLAQLRNRQGSGWNDGWLDHR